MEKEEVSNNCTAVNRRHFSAVHWVACFELLETVLPIKHWKHGSIKFLYNGKLLPRHCKDI